MKLIEQDRRDETSFHQISDITQFPIILEPREHFIRTLHSRSKHINLSSFICTLYASSQFRSGKWLRTYRLKFYTAIPFDSCIQEDAASHIEQETVARGCVCQRGHGVTVCYRRERRIIWNSSTLPHRIVLPYRNSRQIYCIMYPKHALENGFQQHTDREVPSWNDNKRSFHAKRIGRAGNTERVARTSFACPSSFCWSFISLPKTPTVEYKWIERLRINRTQR